MPILIPATREPTRRLPGFILTADYYSATSLSLFARARRYYVVHAMYVHVCMHACRHVVYVVVGIPGNS